ncbi:MAG: hypothetical protein M3R63_02820 [Actinomycetota bacterium]|nr:hypothetical protein [Actinomycetota bacterium]
MTTIIERGITLAPTLAVTEVALPADVHSDLRDRVREFHDAGGRVWSLGATPPCRASSPARN